MEKLKSRWQRNYLEQYAEDDSSKSNNHRHHHHHHHHHSSSKHTPPTYEPINENLYLDKRKSDHGKSRKDRSMKCECVLTKEERARGVVGCLDDCLNRMLMIECGPRCSLGDNCLNKRFQKCQSANVEIFKTKKKGWGLRTTTELSAGAFIMEYVGEVVRSKEFKNRVKRYTKLKIKHHYFMALKNDEIIDATFKGNLTRFINHSCEPNCETQKWTVNGDLRIGFFALKDLKPGDEITFDYQFQRYGRKAQKCYCGTPSCRGYIGGSAEQQTTMELNGESSPQDYFRIPRLSSVDRMEAERRLEEKAITDDDVGKEKPLETTNPLARNKINNTNGTTNNITPKTIPAPIKRKFDSTLTNNIDLTPAPKMSKEEHRKQFEMNVRLKDYYDNIERHYGATIAEQVRLSHRAFNTLYGFPLPFSHNLLANQNIPYLNATTSANYSLASLISPSLVVGQQPLQQQPPQPAQQALAPRTTILQTNVSPTSRAIPTLIVLANQYIEPSYIIDDDLAFSICDYDEYYTIRDRPLEAHDVTAKTYPYPGSYYTTPNGEKWFVTVTMDRKTQQPKTVILNLDELKYE